VNALLGSDGTRAHSCHSFWLLHTCTDCCVLHAGVLPEIGMGWLMYSILGECFDIHRDKRPCTL